MHTHECRRCHEGFDCDGYDIPARGCDAFEGYCPECDVTIALEDYNHSGVSDRP